MSELIKHSSKLWERRSESERHFLIWCPGCGCAHVIPTPRWSFNGDIVSPTFWPSVKHFVVHPDTKRELTTCHYHVAAGKIEYQRDFEHAFKGQTIDLPEIPPDYRF